MTDRASVGVRPAMRRVVGAVALLGTLGCTAANGQESGDYPAPKELPLNEDIRVLEESVARFFKDEEKLQGLAFLVAVEVNGDITFFHTADTEVKPVQFPMDVRLFDLQPMSIFISEENPHCASNTVGGDGGMYCPPNH